MKMQTVQTLMDLTIALAIKDTKEMDSTALVIMQALLSLLEIFSGRLKISFLSHIGVNM